MSDIEYEYYESSDDEEEYIYQNVWHSVTKRIHWHWPNGIVLHLFKEDDISVLSVLLEVVSEGIHSEKLAHLRSIEALENAIVNRPDKKYGYGRIAEIRRLTNLMADSNQRDMYNAAILELYIEDASELNDHILWTIEMQCPHLQRIVFKKHIPTNIRNYFRQVKHIVFDADSIPSLDGILLKGTQTLEIHSASQIRNIHMFKHYVMNQELSVKFVNVVLQDWQAQILQSYIQWDNLQVCLDCETIPYEEWRSQQTKRRKLCAETVNPKPFFY